MSTGIRRGNASSPAVNPGDTPGGNPVAPTSDPASAPDAEAALEGATEQPVPQAAATDVDTADAAHARAAGSPAGRAPGSGSGSRTAPEAADADIPSAEDHPWAPRTLTRAVAARARQLGITLPKPRLRGISHLAAFPAALIAGLVIVALGDSLANRLAMVVFVTTASLLFGVSATYHRGTWSPQHAIILRRFDHANIFLIIAGTYTPLAVALLEPRSAAILLTIAWAGALIGVAFRVFWTHAPRWLYVPAYVALGWIAIFYMPQFLAGGGWAVVWLLVAGGLAYTAGAVVYGLKRPNPSPAWFGFHEIFHAATLAGFACHFVAVAIAVV
ncbi:PAQR family membrane homeostasis protein TrhA [Brachybacterium sp. NBEC-018]|uniref:PAQR family membrane homeostasis protein TrhA n=1 Tax=Brachybacterium sp. NBEC-018 TaxID=2996004 RepID=UPI002B217640|nr:hemolysin III family protein [Brachybacterium sp. NBEC-018]